MGLVERAGRFLRQDDYWHGPRRVSPHFRPGALEGYPIDLRAKAQVIERDDDGLGVPLADFGRVVGRWRHPAAICQAALGWHQRWLAEGDPQLRERFLTIARWLIDHQRPWRSGGAWPIEVTFRSFGRLEAPWPSALVQGQALSVLARAAELDPRLGPQAREAMAASFALFELDVAAGGVRAEDDDGVAFEEYPSARPSIVLNGLISALWGLFDLALVEKRGRARRTFDDAVSALVRRLPRYDLGFWSLYCLYPYPIPCIASPYYHRAHLTQLEVMERLAPAPRFGEMRARFLAYQESGLKRTAALGAKAAFRVQQAWSYTGSPFRLAAAHEFEVARSR